MRTGSIAAALFLVGVALAVLGAAVTNDLTTATGLAALGAGFAAFGGILWVGPTVRHRYAPPPSLAGSTLALLRDSFRTGQLGRQAIVATVVSLERDTGLAREGMNPEEERRLTRLDAAGFRTWLDGRLERLERET